MSDQLGDSAGAVTQELLARLSRRSEQSPRSEVISSVPVFTSALPSPPQLNVPPATSQGFANGFFGAVAAETAVAMANEQIEQDRKASLLSLLNFSKPANASPSPVARAAQPGARLGEEQIHSRDASMSDTVVGSVSMGRPTELESTTPPAVRTLSADTSSAGKPQDQRLSMLNKSQSQRPKLSPRASLTGSSTLAAAAAASPILATSAKSTPPVDTAFTTSTPQQNRDSPIRVFGSRESREPTPFEPQDLATPISKPAEKGIFTYANPFEQLASSRNGGPAASESKDTAAIPSVEEYGSVPMPILKGIAQNIEIASPAPLSDGRSRVEALMGIGAPTTDPEVVSQALENVSEQVEKQVAFEASEQRQNGAKGIKQESGTLDRLAEVTTKGKSSITPDINGQTAKESKLEDLTSSLNKLSTSEGPEALQDMMDEAAAADDEESSGNDDEAQTVPVYNIPLKPFAAIELTQPSLPSLSFRERSITDIARVKKEFDQVDRTLVTASNDYIVYSTPKKPFGIRVIRQEDGKDRQIFKENDPIFNVAVSSSPPGKTHQGIETVIATGTSGTVYWSAICFDGLDQSQDEDVSKHCLVFPPSSGHDGDHTSGGQLKTRAKKSNRHPEYFAIGRGKTIQIVFPFHAMQSNFVKKASRIETEGYFKDRSIKINTSKAGKDFVFSEDDTVLASLDKAGRLRFWDVRDLVEDSNGAVSKLAALIVDTPIMTLPTAHVNDKPWPTSVLFVDKLRPYVRGSALRYVIVGMKQNHTLQLWDLSLGKVVQELALPHENESDAICSVAYHPATGIIVVGHPARNSIYFIHLSAPKYNLQGITQAKYLQAIIQKNPNLPKPESTAIMSGIREYSFASKGQLRSLDLLSSPVSTSDKKTEDDRGQFELYVMHSKGVTCLNISKADLGWSQDNKVITKVDGEDEGVIKVRNLQELKPVEVSEMSSVNGDAIGNSKGISSRTRSPPLESTEIKETTSKDQPAADAQPLTRSEKRKKKRAEPQTEDVFDNIPPPAPVPPTVRNAAFTSTVKKETKAAKPEPKDTTLVKKHTAPPNTDTNLVLPGNGSLVSVQQEFKQLEVNVKEALTTAFEAEFKTLRRGIDEDRRTSQATAAGHQEAVLRLVSQSLTENVDAALQNIVSTNMQKQVLPAINTTTEKAIKKSVPEWLNNTVHQQISKEIKAVIPEAVNNALSNQQIVQTLTEGVVSRLSKRLEKDIQNTVIPEFRKLATSAAADTERRLLSANTTSEAKAVEDGAKIEKLTLLTEDLLETIRRMSEVQSAMRDEMSSMQEEISRLHSTHYNPPSPPALATVEAPVESPKDRELHEIVKLINEGQFEEGTIKWLQSPNQDSIFLRFFINYDPSYLQQCPGLVSLSVGAAILQNLESQIAERLHWVNTALAYLDPLDEEVQSVAPRIMDIITQRLESRYMSLAEANPADPVLKQIPAVVKRAKEIKAVALQLL